VDVVGVAVAEALYGVTLADVDVLAVDVRSLWLALPIRPPRANKTARLPPITSSVRFVFDFFGGGGVPQSASHRSREATDRVYAPTRWWDRLKCP
jgi:hypothetical protein